MLAATAAAQAPAAASSNHKPARKLLSYSPHQLSWGRHATSAIETILVRNAGADSVIFRKPALSGASFRIASNTCTGQLAPAATCTIELTFRGARTLADGTPLYSRLAHGRLMLRDDARNAPQVVTLTGDPIALIAPPPPTSTPSPTPLATPGPQAGMVLIAGGSAGTVVNHQTYQSAELFNPATGIFTAVGNMVTARSGQTATLLPNGKVLLESGGGGSCFQPLSCANNQVDCVITCQNTAELYDPATSSFTATGNTEFVFSDQTAVLLGDGQVLVAGGESSYCTANSPNGPCVVDLTTSVAELYDPASGAFTPTGSMRSRRAGHQAALLPNGDAIEIGASVDSPDVNQAAEIYDLASGAFSLAPGELIMGRVGSTSSFTATALQNGQILVAGGQGTAPGAGILSEAELYDPASGRFTPTGSMSVPRSGHTATLLNDGQVLITGGATTGFIAGNPSALQPSAELYDPVSGTFSPAGNMNVARSGHTATLLSDGRVLIAGGQSPLNPPPPPVCPPPGSLAPCYEQFSAATASAEIYDPSTGAFTPTGNMTIARASHTATLLK